MKLLIVSPTPTHPQNAGNRSRIFEMCTLFKAQGYSLSFLYINKERGDTKAMKEYFMDGYYEFNPESEEVETGLKKFFKKLSRSIKKRITPKPTIKSNEAYNKLVDDYYDSNIDDFVKKELSSQSFTHVMVEYVTYSKVLENFDKDTIKIIDTHDILSNRYQLFLEQKLVPQWYSLYPEEEGKGLNRADIVFAIQEKEKKYFEEICSAKVVLFGHLTPIITAFCEHTAKLLFVGSDNQINIDALNFFVKSIFPKILVQVPNTTLVVAGTICNKKKAIQFDPRIEFYGTYQTNHEIYSYADVVVIPVFYGTGLKIKTVDALSSSKAVVTLNEGISGLEAPNAANPYCLLATNEDDFAEKVIHVLTNTKLKNELELNASVFMKNYNAQIIQTINNDIFNFTK